MKIKISWGKYKGKTLDQLSIDQLEEILEGLPTISLLYRDIIREFRIRGYV